MKTPKDPMLRGLRNRSGEWHYRFKIRGREHSGNTGLSAEEENIPQALVIRAQALQESRQAKPAKRQFDVLIADAVPRFHRWYRSEHQNRDCKWARSLLASFEYFFTVEHRTPLRSIASAELEDFKAWRRENGVHDNTLRKQLILLRGFFSYARKQGWLLTDPFENGEDTEVKIPAEVDSDVMHVLSLEEQACYFAVAKRTPDLFDVATIMIELGPRPDEVMSLQQSHVDLFNRHFTIWDSSAEGKSKNAHRKLKMTPAVFRIFAQRLTKPGLWVFPSSKTSGPRTTLQKAHTQAATAAGVPCRLYDMRHTFATRFALRGGSLPILAKILGHADLSLLMRYVHPSQADMDRAIEAFASGLPDAKTLEALLVGGGGRSTFGPLSVPEKANSGQFRAKNKQAG